jgi:hypothetical protein
MRMIDKKLAMRGKTFGMHSGRTEKTVWTMTSLHFMFFGRDAQVE